MTLGDPGSGGCTSHWVRNRESCLAIPVMFATEEAVPKQKASTDYCFLREPGKQNRKKKNNVRIYIPVKKILPAIIFYFSYPLGYLWDFHGTCKVKCQNGNCPLLYASKRKDRSTRQADICISSRLWTALQPHFTASLKKTEQMRMLGLETIWSAINFPACLMKIECKSFPNFKFWEVNCPHLSHNQLSWKKSEQLSQTLATPVLPQEPLQITQTTGFGFKKNWRGQP